MINPNNFIDWVMQLNFNMVAKTGEIIANSIDESGLQIYVDNPDYNPNPLLTYSSTVEK